MTTHTHRGSVLRTSQQLRKQIEARIKQQLEEVIQNSRQGKNTRRNPFYSGLPKRMLRASRIERSISVSAATLYQSIAADIAQGAGYRAETEVEIKGEMSSSVRNYISTITSKSKTAAPNVPREYNALFKRAVDGQRQTQGEDATIDLYVNIKGKEYYFDMKTPQPNSEQCRAIKVRLLEVKTLRLPSRVEAVAVFPFNPDPKKTHRVGSKYLDYGRKEVLVGNEFWDLIGGRGTYTQLVSIFRKVYQARRRALEELFLKSRA